MFFYPYEFQNFVVNFHWNKSRTFAAQSDVVILTSDWLTAVMWVSVLDWSSPFYLELIVRQVMSPVTGGKGPASWSVNPFMCRWSMRFRDTTGLGSSGRSSCRRPSTWRTWLRMRPVQTTSLFTASRHRSQLAGSADTSTRRPQVGSGTHGWSWWCNGSSWCFRSVRFRVVLGVSAEALVLPAAVGGPDPVQRGCGLVWVHLLQHPARPVAVCRVHPASRAGLQLPVHRGESRVQLHVSASVAALRSASCPVSPPDGVLHHHLLPVHLRLLDCVPDPGLQLLLPGLPPPDGRLQPPVQRHVSDSMWNEQKIKAELSMKLKCLKSNQFQQNN